MLKKFYVMDHQFPPSFSPVKTRRKGNKFGRLVKSPAGGNLGAFALSCAFWRLSSGAKSGGAAGPAMPCTPRAPWCEKRVGSSSAAASSRRKVGGAKGIDFGNIFRGLEALPASLPLCRAVPTCSRTICPKLEALQPRNKGLWSAQSHQFGTGGGEERLRRCRGHLWLASEMPQLLGQGSKKKNINEQGRQRLDLASTRLLCESARAHAWRGARHGDTAKTFLSASPPSTAPAPWSRDRFAAAFS